MKEDLFVLRDLELGKQSVYDSNYNPNKLFSIPRQLKRKEIGIQSEKLPFFGFDCWNHYEVSWLNDKGKPVVAVAEIVYNCDSPNIIESKSMKLYFNSFNNTKFNNPTLLENTIRQDLEKYIGASVHLKLIRLTDVKDEVLYKRLDGTCLDDLDIECTSYTIDTSYLFTEMHEVEETLYSDLLKSNCLVTNQPDWASIQIRYKGKKINNEGLLKYIVSFRNHNEFHEQCIERIFVDIMHRCKPLELTVYGRYTRRGGLDINPYRSTKKETFSGKNLRCFRQ